MLRVWTLYSWEGRQWFRPSSVITLLFVQCAVITIAVMLPIVTCPATFPIADFVKPSA